MVLLWYNWCVVKKKLIFLNWSSNLQLYLKIHPVLSCFTCIDISVGSFLEEGKIPFASLNKASELVTRRTCTGYAFSRTFRQLRDAFPRLPLAASGFPALYFLDYFMVSSALSFGCIMFSRRSQWLHHILPRLPLGRAVSFDCILSNL